MKNYKPSQVAIANTRFSAKKNISKTCTITKDPLPAETETQIKTISNQISYFLDDTIYTLTEFYGSIVEAIISVQ